jgi:chromosome segregation ATPase
VRATERRLFRLNEELQRLRGDLEQTAGELEMHRHLDDDARRDAAVSDSPPDRAEAQQTARDVRRIDAAVGGLRRRIAELEDERDRLLSKLGTSP